MVCTRAPASDVDEWGVEGWESKNLILLMKKSRELVDLVFVKLKLFSHSFETYEVYPDRTAYGYNGCPPVDLK
jgi:hypothetical protein